MEKNILNILEKVSDGTMNPEDAQLVILSIFKLYKRFLLSYWDADNDMISCEVYAIDRNESIKQLFTICPEATYIISREI